MSSRKNKRTVQKRRKERKQRREKVASRVTLDEQLRQVDVHCERGDYEQARKQLEDVRKRFGDSPLLLQKLLGVLLELKDNESYMKTVWQLQDLQPDDPDTWLMLANGYYLVNRTCACLHALQQVLRLDPQTPLADGIRKNIAQIEPIANQEIEASPFRGDDAVFAAAMHEQMLAGMQLGEWHRAIGWGERLAGLCGDFVPVWNNLSETHGHLGQYEAAVRCARRAVEMDPTNSFGLANLSRFLLFVGERAEAEAVAKRLTDAPVLEPQHWFKKAEAFATLGDDASLLALVPGFEGQYSKIPKDIKSNSLHLMAVAYMRQGDEDQAKRFWKRALQVDRDNKVARENFDDVRRDRDETHAPWPFSMRYWLPKEIIDRLGTLTRGKTTEAQVQAANRQLLQEYPHLIHLIPELLDRGDRGARTCAILLATSVPTPEIDQTLRNYALGQRGPLSSRQHVLNQLCRRGVVQNGDPVTVWQHGKWEEVIPYGYDVYREPDELPESLADPLEAEAHHAIENGDFQLAEALLRHAIELDSDIPSLYNNLALALEKQGKTVESQDLLVKLHGRFPDYLFGCIGMAQRAISQGDLEAAGTLLRKVMRRNRFHIAEYNAMCAAQVRWLLLKEDLGSAEHWLDMWSSVEPDHPAIARLQFALRMGKATEALARMSRKKKGRR